MVFASCRKNFIEKVKHFLHFIEKTKTLPARTSETLEERINIFRMNDMLVES